MTKTKWYAKSIYVLVALVLVLSLGIVALPMAGTVEADGSPPTFTLPGGSLTADLGPWGGTGHVYPLTFDVTAPGGIDIIFYDVDGSLLQYDNESWWEDALKGSGMVGVTAGTAITSIDPPNDAVWSNMQNQNTSSSTDWSGNSVSTLGPDGTPFTSDDTRSWLFQSWYRPSTGGKTGHPDYGDPAYNSESYETPNPRFPGAPTHSPDYYCTFDLRLKITHDGGNNYTAQRWVRMHNCASVEEGCPYCACGVYNHAINNCGPDAAWRQFENGAGVYTFPMTNIDLTAVHPFVGIGNFPVPAAHTLTWGDIVVTGAPTPQAEVWVDDNWTGYSYGDPADGHTFGYDAFATIQDGIDNVAGSTVNVAAGTYDLEASIRVDKSVSIIGDPDNPENVVINAGTIPANSGPKPPDRDRDAFQVAANNVVIKGFNIINALNLMTGAGDGWQNAGITVGGDITLIDWLDPYDEPILIDGGTFSNNIIENCSCGIYLAMSKSVTVSDNIIRYSTVGSDSSFSANAGVGIMNWNTKAWVNWQDPVNNVIERNIVEYSDRQGICLGAWDPDIFSVNGTVIRDNTIRFSGQWGPTPGIDLMYVTGSLSITGNDIHSNPTGIGVGPEISGAEAHFNNIYDNINFGADVWDWTGTASLDATCNWWGHVSGPSGGVADPVTGTLANGTGDAVSKNVHFDPWLKTPYPLFAMASFVIDHAKIDFKKKVEDDKVRVKGKLELDLDCGDGVDISEDVTVTVGPLSQTINMEQKGKKGEKWEYKRPKGDDGNIKHMTINWKNGKFDIRMDKAELTGMSNPVTISIQIGDDVGEETILMREKKHHWDYKAHGH